MSDSGNVAENWMQYGGPAFPIKVADIATFRGMTLRDWFAGQFLNGYATRGPFASASEDIAKRAYNFADAMLAERAKEK